MPPIVIVRGAPGTGKSTICRDIARRLGFDHYEADMYHTRGGQFLFDSRRARAAHQWCRTATMASVAAGRGVTLGNPLLDLYDMHDYLHMSDEVLVVSLTHRYGSTHAPRDVEMRMRLQFEHHDLFADRLPRHVRTMTEEQLAAWVADRAGRSAADPAPAPNIGDSIEGI